MGQGEEEGGRKRRMKQWKTGGGHQVGGTAGGYPLDDGLFVSPK